jgi:hypothetical protein
MKRILTSTRSKVGLAFLSGGALVTTGFALLDKEPAPLDPGATSWRPQVISNFLKRHLVSADSMTTSVLDPKFQRAQIPWDANWDK